MQDTLGIVSMSFGFSKLLSIIEARLDAKGRYAGKDSAILSRQLKVKWISVSIVMIFFTQTGKVSNK